MRRAERAAVRSAAHVIAVSPADAAVLRDEFGAPRVSVIETGVDTDYFRPTDPGLREPDHVVFVGSMDWLPNEDAVRWFVEEILARIRTRRPAARLTIVGRDPPAAVRALGNGGRGVTVTGRVPDVRTWLARASAVVVPLRIGSGTRLKIFEAMACGAAVVSTTIGAEGLAVTPGRDILLADAPEQFAAAVVELLEDPARARALGERARRLVEERFDWSGVAQRFAEVCGAVVRGDAGVG